MMPTEAGFDRALGGREIRFSFVLGLIFLCLVVSTGCTDAPAIKELRIGLLVPLTGDLELETEPLLIAADLAIAEAGGPAGRLADYRIELFTADSEGTAEGALEAARQLVIRDRVDAIVGPYLSRAVMGCSSLVDELQVPLLSPTATNSEVAAGHRFVFRVSQLDDSRHARALARLAAEDLAVRRAAILYELTDPYSQGVAEVFRRRFEQRGGEIVAFEGYSTGAASFDQQLIRIREADPEALLLPNISPFELNRQVVATRALGIDAILLGADSWSEHEFDVAALGDAYYSDHWHPESPREASSRFVELYRAAVGEEVPSAGAAMTFDAFGLLLESVARASVGDQELSGPRIQSELAKIAGFDGVTGELSFRSGDTRNEPVIIRMTADGTSIFHEFGRSLKELE